MDSWNLYHGGHRTFGGGTYFPAPLHRDIQKAHYCDVIMGAMASQITSLTIVYSAVYLGSDQRNHQSSTSGPLCGEFTDHRWIPRTVGQWRGKCLLLMTSSWRLSTGTSKKPLLTHLNNALSTLSLLSTHSAFIKAQSICLKVLVTALTPVLWCIAGW